MGHNTNHISLCRGSPMLRVRLIGVGMRNVNNLKSFAHLIQPEYVAVAFVKRTVAGMWTAVYLSRYWCFKSCPIFICLNIPYHLLIHLRYTGELQLSSFPTVFFDATWIHSLSLQGERPNPSSTPPLSKRFWFSQRHLCRYIAGVPRENVQ